ncbi:MAG TPA: DNA methyltransferase [Candidatus Saccharimonadales bacterium]|nr:DNA methyltransferase [Candidatus Saccharimonadales bacterium]
MSKRTTENFIAHWSSASPSERANSQPFLLDLCDVLDLPHPDPHPGHGYFFEFPIVEHHADGTTSNGRIDLYKRNCFVLESKQFQDARPEQTNLELAAEKIGAVSKARKSAAPVRDTERWDDAMLKALVQGQRYIRALPAGEPYPPFLLVVDVGHAAEIRADFSLTGRSYLPFPDPLTYRIRLEQLKDERVRERLKLIWTDPLALDPASHSAEVTREVAKHLAELAKSFEKKGHTPKVVAEFLARCLFCMFAQDVGLLPDREKRGFTELLDSLPADGNGFEDVIRQLFREMNTGTGKSVSVILRRKLLQFNGGLFADDSVLPVNGTQLGILKAAARQDWKHVEPAIFGTLLERALGGEGERHKLGAHFTPRAYVERLVLPTVVEPLRAEWESVRAAAVALGKRGDIQAAREEINVFHERLCKVTVLDPACGCGNFLYVSLEHLKRLEGEVLDFANQFGESFRLELTAHTVDPHQFLGLEINPRAVAITEMVLWIGYLQWHFRTRGQTPPREPVLKQFDNIQRRDAVLEYDGEPRPARNQAGGAVTVWDRHSTKTDMVTGRQVPDETKRIPLLTYSNPRPAQWPQADFIVGNPPFIGTARMREDLGDGYAETLRATYPDVPESADFVLYWWHKAAELTRAGRAKRFGLITTNSLRQTFARRVVQAQLSAKPPLSLLFAIPDHPWVDTAEGAAVRIAMTVGAPGELPGELLEVTAEEPQPDGSEKVSFKSKHGQISADLTTGANASVAATLKANEKMSSEGVKLHGLGFVVTADEAKSLGLGRIAGLEKHIRPYLNGRDLTGEPRNAMVIDLFGLTVDKVRQKFPEVYQHVLTTVKPERDSNNRATYRDNWWVFGEPRREFRPALVELRRYIATVKTAKHRVFQFLDSIIIPDSKLIAFPFDDAHFLGVLSSRIHCLWALTAGSWLGVGNDPTYVKSTSFEKFPFPLCGEAEKKPIRKLAEELDAHRKRVQAQHSLTLTSLYNILEKIRANEPLTAKEKLIHDKALVSVLKQLHDDLDAAVFAAYGWPAKLTDAEILERLVALNAERAADEKRGIVHWLRPKFQARDQTELVLPATTEKPVKHARTKTVRATKSKWPKSLSDRVKATESALHHFGGPVTPSELAKQFKRAKPADVAEILETLVTLGRARNHAGQFSR